MPFDLDVQWHEYLNSRFKRIETGLAVLTNYTMIGMRLLLLHYEAGIMIILQMASTDDIKLTYH